MPDPAASSRRWKKRLTCPVCGAPRVIRNRAATWKRRRLMAQGLLLCLTLAGIPWGLARLRRGWAHGVTFLICEPCGSKFTFRDNEILGLMD
ncbi:MAG: hypothetical protein HY719_16930 [Planctomycetes bacterium]|nr:hypothetical protein [Planctomycetota bacterium]